jgi:hypothetical protein
LKIGEYLLEVRDYVTAGSWRELAVLDSPLGTENHGKLRATQQRKSDLSADVPFPLSLADDRKQKTIDGRRWRDREGLPILASSSHAEGCGGSGDVECEAHFDSRSALACPRKV